MYFSRLCEENILKLLMVVVISHLLFDGILNNNKNFSNVSNKNMLN